MGFLFPPPPGVLHTLFFTVFADMTLLKPS